MRCDDRVPAAIVRLIDRGGPWKHCRVVSFDLEPGKRRLLGRCTSLEAADRSVLHRPPAAYRIRICGVPPNGR